MADKMTLNQGVGGEEIAVLRRADGSIVAVGALAYATALATDENVVQVVDASHGLPVEVLGGVEVSQADPDALKATVHQGGAWTTTAIQSTAANLNATAHLAAGTNLVGKAAAGIDGSTVYSGVTPLTRKFAKIAASASGDNTIVAAVADHRIRVIRWGFTARGDVDAKWRSGSTDITGARPLTKYASAGGAYCPVGLFQTSKGEALNLNLSAAVGVEGELTYVEVPDVGAPSGPEGGTGIDP